MISKVDRQYGLCHLHTQRQLVVDLVAGGNVSACVVFQSGLIVACYHGYVEVVIALAQCPYLDVNWQDNEGNTALITAAQAGKTTGTLAPRSNV